MPRDAALEPLHAGTVRLRAGTEPEVGLGIAGLIGAELALPDGRHVLIEREIGDGLLDIRELPSDNLFRVEDPRTGERRLPDARFIEQLSASGDLRIVRRRDCPAPRPGPAFRAYTREEILAKDPFAAARLTILRGLRDRGVSAVDPRLGGAISEISEGDLERKFGAKPTTRRVREWFGCGDLETIGLTDVMSRSGRVPRRSSLDPALNAIYEEHAHAYWYKKKRGWHVVDATGDAVDARKEANALRVLTGEPPLPEVNKETMRRRVNALECRDAYASKFGEAAAKRRYDGGGKGITASRILQVCLMDDTVVDLVTVVHQGIAGRPYLCAMLDVNSRCGTALVVSMTPPSHHTAGLCLRRANRSKKIAPRHLARHPALAWIGGKPTLIVVDNGRNFCSPAFVETCADLGIAVQVAPVSMPRAKPMIERFFRTFKQYLIEKLPGHTLDPSQLRKLGIDPATEAVVTLETLQMLVEEFLVFYHTTEHSGISARPVDRGKASMDAGHRHVLDSEERLDALFGVVVPNRRITANGGVRVFGNLTYKAPGMRERIIDRLIGREPHATRLDATAACTVKIRYDPADLGRIFVEVGSKWVPLHCTDPEYVNGLSKWQHDQIRAYARRERRRMGTEQEKLLARAELNRMIAEQFPDLPAQERRAAARFLVGEAPSAVANVEHAVAESRHDGMGPIIEHQTAHRFRKDTHRASDRPSGRSDPTVEDVVDPDRDDAVPSAAVDPGAGPGGFADAGTARDPAHEPDGSSGPVGATPVDALEVLRIDGPDRGVPDDDDHRFEDFA